MRGPLSALLVFEAIIVALSIPVAVRLSGVDVGSAAGVGLGIAAACIAVCAFVGKPAGRVAGSVLQVVTFLLGFVVTAMFVLGVIFGGLWVALLVLDRRVEQIQQAHLAAGGSASATSDEAPS
ncbi:MAG: DUF4233 domain-containing protein [Streptosporangiaceae bacterium]